MTVREGAAQAFKIIEEASVCEQEYVCEYVSGCEYMYVRIASAHGSKSVYEFVNECEWMNECVSECLYPWPHRLFI